MKNYKQKHNQNKYQMLEHLNYLNHLLEFWPITSQHHFIEFWHIIFFSNIYIYIYMYVCIRIYFSIYEKKKIIINV